MSLGVDILGLKELFARRSLSALIVNILGLGLAFLLQIFMARTLGAEQYGVYVYVVSWCTMLAMISKLGFDNATLRYISVYSSTSSYGLMRGFLRRRDQVGFLFGISISLCVIGYVLFVQQSMDQELVEAFLIGALLIPTMCLLMLNESTLRALLFTISAQVPSQLVRPVFVGLILSISLFVFGVELTGSIAVVSFLMACFLVLFISVFLVWRRLPSQINEIKPSYKTEEWIKASASLMVMSMIMMLLNELDILMVGWLLNPEEAGIYSVGLRLSMLVLFGLNAVNVIIGPLIARLYSANEMAELSRVVYFTGLGLFIFSVPVSLVLIVFGDVFLGIFGSEFLRSERVLVILSIAQLVNALSGSVGYLLTMTGYTKQATIAVGIGLAGHMVLNLFLIPRYGVEGAAISMAVSTVFWNVLLCLLVWRYLRINTWSFLAVSGLSFRTRAK